MPIITANVVMQYSDNSVRDATVIAWACKIGSPDEIRTKKTINEMMVMTMTKIPVNRPVLAWVQSTE